MLLLPFMNKGSATSCGLQMIALHPENNGKTDFFLSDKHNYHANYAIKVQTDLDELENLRNLSHKISYQQKFSLDNSSILYLSNQILLMNNRLVI
jgi:hypothetical protein